MKPSGWTSPMKATFVLASLLLSVLPATAETTSPVESPLSVVVSVVDAFNRHDAGALATHLHADVRWWAVGVEGSSLDGEGRTAIEEAMRSYFEVVPDVRSEILQSMVVGTYVLIEERVLWDGRSQRAVGIYQIEDRLVRSVWYFPPLKRNGGRIDGDVAVTDPAAAE